MIKQRPDMTERLVSTELLVDEGDRAELEQVGNPIRYSRGNLLFGEGEETDFALLIRKGYVKITVGSPDKIVGIRGPGEVVGEMAAIEGSPRSASVYAMTDIDALFIPATAWRHFLETHASAALNLVALMSKRLREATRKQVAQGNLAIERRIAMSLIDLGERIGEPADPATTRLDITQNELAGLTGTSRETVSQIVGQLRDRGIVRTGRQRISICNADELARLARGEISLSY
jgi:CRP/FNR family cyclic AMP-dependent transcriptional regulator